jgi:hypothetical protein
METLKAAHFSPALFKFLIEDLIRTFNYEGARAYALADKIVIISYKLDQLNLV